MVSVDEVEAISTIHQMRPKFDPDFRQSDRGDSAETRLFQEMTVSGSSKGLSISSVAGGQTLQHDVVLDVENRYMVREMAAAGFLSFQKPSDGFYMGEVQSLSMLSEGGQGLEQDATLERRMARKQGACGNPNLVGSGAAKDGGIFGLEKRFDPFVFVQGDFGELAEQLGNGIRKGVLQQGQNVDANGIASADDGAVGFVLDPGNLVRAQKIENFRSLDTNQGTDNLSLPDRRNPGCPMNAATPQQGQQHLFGVVVRLMAQGDFVVSVCCGRPAQKGIADSSGCIFERNAFAQAMVSTIDGGRKERKTQLSAEGLNKDGIGIRSLSSPLVVQMGDSDAAGAGFREGQQDVEQGDGIGAARYGHKDGFTWADHPMSADGFGNFSLQLLGQSYHQGSDADSLRFSMRAFKICGRYSSANSLGNRQAPTVK